MGRVEGRPKSSRYPGCGCFPCFLTPGPSQPQKGNKAGAVWDHGLLHHRLAQGLWKHFVNARVCWDLSSNTRTAITMLSGDNAGTLEEHLPICGSPSSQVCPVGCREDPPSSEDGSRHVPCCVPGRSELYLDHGSPSVSLMCGQAGLYHSFLIEWVHILTSLCFSLSGYIRIYEYTHKHACHSCGYEVCVLTHVCSE